MNFDAIFVLGPQGSGKGTQAKLLSEKLGFYHWDTGAVLRKNADVVTVSGERAGDILQTGRLFTDEELLSVVKRELETIPQGKDIVFDGIPRRIGQAEFLLDFLKFSNRTRFATILLDIPKEESLKRLLLRAEKEGRSDDTREAIEKRLDEYEKNTVPMLGLLRKETDFFEIDGRPSIEEVRKSVWEVLDVV